MAKVGKLTESNYLAITGDVIRSRDSQDRDELQRQLLAALAAVSKSLERALVADVQLTAGDEIQALLRKPEAAVRLLQELSDALHPVHFTFGLGWGALSTALPSRRSSRRLPLLDGACFHHAREALAEARERGAWAGAAGFGELGCPLNALLELVGNLRLGWTEKQGLYSAAARLRAQKEVAAQFGVNPSVVSESLKGARLELVRRGEEGIEALLRRFGKNAESVADSAHRPNRRRSER